MPRILGITARSPARTSPSCLLSWRSATGPWTGGGSGQVEGILAKARAPGAGRRRLPTWRGTATVSICATRASLLPGGGDSCTASGRSRTWNPHRGRSQRQPVLHHPHRRGLNSIGWAEAARWLVRPCLRPPASAPAPSATAGQEKRLSDRARGEQADRHRERGGRNLLGEQLLLNTVVCDGKTASTVVIPARSLAMRREAGGRRALLRLSPGPVSCPHGRRAASSSTATTTRHQFVPRQR